MEKALDAAVAPWAQLGIVGSVVIVLAIICVLLWRKLERAQEACLSEVRACAAATLDITIKKIESDSKLADALEGLERVVEAAMGRKL